MLGRWLPWGAVAVVVLGLAWAGEPAQALLRYQRDAVLAGEIWRSLTAHWVHLSVVHAVLNLLGLLLIQSLADGFDRPGRSLGMLMGCQLGVSALLLVVGDQLAWYLGLSAALHGQVVVLAWTGRRLQTLPAVLVSLAVAAKVVWELTAGPSASLEALVGGPVLVVAHLYGALSGAAMAVAVLCLRRLGADGRHGAGKDR